MRGVRLQLGSSGGSRRRTQLAEDARRARAADEVDPVAIPPSGRAADGMLSAGQRGAQSTSDDRVAASGRFCSPFLPSRRTDVVVQGDGVAGLAESRTVVSSATLGRSGFVA